MNPKQIKVIGFDADDTLWINENHYRDIELFFAKQMAAYTSESEALHQLYKTEMQNIDVYGYGAKSFLLSLIETAIKISDNQIPAEVLAHLMKAGKRLLSMPVELIEGAEETLDCLYGKYKLLLITKGDLLDQQRKLRQSGLSRYFHHIEIVSEKLESDYRAILQTQNIVASEFFMVGNSLKSDILPVIRIGGYAAHIPHEVTWFHEDVKDYPRESDVFFKLNNIREIIRLF